MEDTNSLSNSSDGEEEEEGGGGENMLAITPFLQPKLSEGSSVTPNSNNLLTVALDRGKRITSYSKKRPLTGHNKAKSCAIERAKEIQANLDPGLPSFVKSMHPSHVGGQFKMGLPYHFCDAHFPKENVMINVIDENKEVYPVTYSMPKLALIGGWRVFSLAHKLVEGDALVFQLVQPTELQVYIVRAYSMAEIDGVIALQNLDSRQQSGPCKRTKISKKTAKKNRKSLSLGTPQQPGGKSRSDSEEVGSEVLQRIRILGPRVEFKDVKNLESFTISVNGLIVDTELSEQVRRKYYELCSSQKAFLHDNLLMANNCKLLAAGLISQIAYIADAIRASKLNTSGEEFAAWDKSLGAFEELGMNVGFLRSRIKKLANLVVESADGVELKMYKEAIAGRNNMKEEIRSLKTKLVELEEASKRFDIEVESLRMKVEEEELKFQAEADAPWGS